MPLMARCPLNKQKLSLLPGGWNTRVLTQHDFESLCAQAGIHVCEVEMSIDGCYCVLDVGPTIFLSRRLFGTRRLRVAFHELGHHLLHYPGVQFFQNTHGKCEFEAELVAACALIPATLLESHSAAEIAEEYGYEVELIEFRRRVYRDWGI